MAVEILELLCHPRKHQRFHVISDSAYGGQSVLCCLPTNCGLTSRLVKDARLYGPIAKAEQMAVHANGASDCRHPRRSWRGAVAG